VREPRAVLRAAAAVYFGIVERDPGRWVLLHGGGAVPLTGELGAQLEVIQSSNVGLYLDAVGRWAHDGVTADQLGQVVNMIWGAAGSLARWWLLNRHVSLDDVVDSYTDFCWNALTPLLAESALAAPTAPPSTPAVARH
jgi:hypothetical protein